MTRPIPSPFERTKLVTNGKTLDEGRKLAYDTHRWMESHESAFRSILRFTQSLKQKKVKGRLRDRVAVYCMDNNIRTGNGEYRFGNALWAGVSRYMVLVDPSLKYNPVDAKESVIDVYGLLPVSYLELEYANE